MAAGTYRNISGNPALAYGLVAAGELSGMPLFLGSYPITPASDILHGTEQAEEVRRRDLPGGGRDRRHRCGGRRLLRRCARPDDDIGSRRRPQVRGHRPGGLTGTPAPDRRRAARWPLDRTADEDRAVGPAAGDVRSQRRVARADHRSAVAFGLLLGGHRGGAHRDRVPHAGLHPLRRLHRQRFRALARPRRVGAAGDQPELRHRPNHTAADGTEEFWPYLRDPETSLVPGQCRERRSGAPHRRAGEVRRSWGHLLRPGEPRPHGATAPGEDRRHRRLAPR